MKGLRAISGSDDGTAFCGLFHQHETFRYEERSMEFFPDVKKIRYEGPEGKNPLAFRHYNSEEKVEGKTMREHLRFAVAYWHTMRGMGSDPFGPGCALRPWEDGTDSLEMAKTRVRVMFEFMEKLGVDYYCFHDRDVAPEGSTLSESHKPGPHFRPARTRTAADRDQASLGDGEPFQQPSIRTRSRDESECRCLRSRGRSDQKAIEVTQRLGGSNYVFWGGREGYSHLLNTDMKRELDHLAQLFHLAVDFKKRIGFQGTFLIEPKPKEPTTHQYDYDAAAVVAFLKTMASTRNSSSTSKPITRHWPATP